PHAEPEHFAPQQYLPKDILGTYFYTPSNQGYEAEVKERLARSREAPRPARLKAIYSSPLERTMQTAQALAAVHGLRVHKRPGLIETDLGSWEGQSLRRL